MGSDDGNAKKVKRKKRRSKQSRIHPSDSEASREEYTIDSHGNQSLTIEEELNDSGDSPSSSNLLIKPKKSTTPYKSSILKAAAVTSFLGNGVTKGVKATSKAGKTAADDGMRNVMAAKRGARKFLALGKRQKQKSRIDDPNSASISNLSDRNKDLIGYFAGLAKSDDPEVQVDLDHIEDLVRKGANINCTDRTPLHVAAAVDYPDMIKLLLERGADIECCSKGENQTPLHFAARNDACEALKLLVKMKANLHSRDYKQRTPLQVAAELGIKGHPYRSETAKLLLQLGADASDSDIAGQTALVLMITKMPAVAKLALDQFHKLDRANRLQYYDINYIEPTKPDDPEPRNKTAMSVIVQFNQLELIMHPVIQRLIDIKWRKFGK
nr:transient receptor potential cation channel subfamily A member 1-8 [Apostichopus japonicus]